MGGRWAEQAAEMELKLPRYPVGYAVAQIEAAVVHAVINDPDAGASYAGVPATVQMEEGHGGGVQEGAVLYHNHQEGPGLLHAVSQGVQDAAHCIGAG